MSENGGGGDAGEHADVAGGEPAGALGGPAQPTLSTAARYGSIGIVWLAALVFAVLIAALARPGGYTTWTSLALAGCVLVGLVVQLGTQQKDGFVNRLAASGTGAFVILGATGAVLAAVAATR